MSLAGEVPQDYNESVSGKDNLNQRQQHPDEETIAQKNSEDANMTELNLDEEIVTQNGRAEESVTWKTPEEEIVTLLEEENMSDESTGRGAAESNKARKRKRTKSVGEVRIDR